MRRVENPVGTGVFLSRREFTVGVSGLLTAAVVVGVAKPAHALTSSQAQRIVAAARTKLNTAYKLPPDGFPRNTDCSLLTQWAYAQAGIQIPRTSAAQFDACRFSTTRAGSLIFFDTVHSRPKRVTHVGINLGDGRMIDANSVAGKVIEENWATSTYWRPRLIGSATL
jgi:cell wall-associated NlpC family hydrolase